MSTLTKEWLQQTIAELEEERDAVPGVVNENAAMALAAMKLALASLEAEPVADVVAWSHPNEERTCDVRLRRHDISPGPLYTAPPAPVALPVQHWEELCRQNPDMSIGDAIIRAAWWNHCAAMLQGAENAESPTTMQTAPELDYSPKNAESPTGINQGKSEPVTTAYKLPMQPLVIDAHGTLRFKKNLIVRKLLDYATEHGYGLNEMAREEFDAEDRMQLAQLIGYSLSGYGTLSYVTDESYECAAATAPQQEVK
ncbi:hypothetical protein [Enterobacter hormaechei]|uniref:hypothetical protein n=1 Tax=Enterobacter hormaechei TaxID=158836 RepID=UPI0031CE5C00